MLVTIPRVTRNEEAAVKRIIADQQLVGVRGVSSHTVPQSISTSTFPIVTSGRYGLSGLSLEVNLFSSLVINKDDFCKLNEQ